MSGDGRVDEVAAEPPQARKGPVLVAAEAGCNQRHPKPGSPRASGSRSLRPSGSRYVSANPGRSLPKCGQLPSPKAKPEERTPSFFKRRHTPSAKLSKGYRPFKGSIFGARFVSIFAVPERCRKTGGQPILPRRPADNPFAAPSANCGERRKRRRSPANEFR